MSTTAALPAETRCESPKRASVEIAMQPEPECETTASPPAHTLSGTEELYRDVRCVTFTNPRQFGPQITNPVRSHNACNSACSLRPSAPVSANPLAKTTAARTPRAAASSSVGRTLSADSATTAQSGASGNDARFA